MTVTAQQQQRIAECAKRVRCFAERFAHYTSPDRPIEMTFFSSEEEGNEFNPEVPQLIKAYVRLGKDQAVYITNHLLDDELGFTFWDYSTDANVDILGTLGDDMLHELACQIIEYHR